MDRVLCITAIDEIDADGKVNWGSETDVNWNTQTAMHKRVRWECMDCNHQALRSKFLPRGFKVKDE